MSAPRSTAPRGAVRELLLAGISGALLLLVLMLPDLGPPVTGPAPVTAYHARITALLDPNRPDRERPGGGFLPDGRVVLLEGPQAGEEVGAYLQGPGGQQDSTGYRVGEEVVVTATRGGDAASDFVAVRDRWRLPQLGWLAVVFAAAIIVIGGWRGLRALLALALTIAITVRILVPLVVQGVPPIPVAVSLATVITILTIGLTEGFSRVSVAAILGTAGALAFTALLAAATIAMAGFSNAADQELIFLEVGPGVGLDLRGLLLAAFMLGTIGVLDDVTVTQAVAVDELVAHTRLRGRRLFASAFNVGRAHIAATVNTLFLAYLGASLPLIVLLSVSGQPASLVINGEAVAIEIVRTLVGSLGIVAAVPFTTLIAVWLLTDVAPTQAEGADPGRARPPVDGPFPGLRRRPGTILFVGLAAIGLATAAAAIVMAPLIGSPPRTAVVPDRLDGFSATPTPSLQASPGHTTGTTSLPGIFRAGTPIPLRDDGVAIGTVEVVQHRIGVDATGQRRLYAEVRYRADRALAIRPEAWVANSLEGEAAVGRSSVMEPALRAGTLPAGQTTTGWVDFALRTASAQLFLDYLDSGGRALFSVALF